MIKISTDGTTTSISVNSVDLSQTVTGIEFLHNEEQPVPVVKLTFSAGEVRMVGSPSVICNADIHQIADALARELENALKSTSAKRG